MSKDTGGHAFPTVSNATDPRNTGRFYEDGMALRQYAAIKLRVPDSGDAWLDDMIREAQRYEFAAKAPPPPENWRGGERDADSLSVWAYRYADAMLAARSK